VNATLQKPPADQRRFYECVEEARGCRDRCLGGDEKVSEAVGHITITADKTTDTLTATKSAAISFDKTMVEVRLLVHDASKRQRRAGNFDRRPRGAEISRRRGESARARHPLV